MRTEAVRKYHREWFRRARAANPEKYRKYARERARVKYRIDPVRKARVLLDGRLWREANREKYLTNMRARSLMRRFGITLEQYDKLVAAQNGLCALCKKPPKKTRLSIDHCHREGHIRGLLCNGCNRLLGVMEKKFGLMALYLYLCAFPPKVEQKPHKGR